MSNYADLIVWQKSMDLVMSIYAYTAAFPREEQFGLISQMRRAAVSIPSNIAEGSRRRGRDLRNFLLIAFGSGSELETQLEISRRLGYGAEQRRADSKQTLTEIMRMLNKMING